jgi:hypothetical protein
MLDILLIIAAIFVGLWILGGVLVLLGFMVHVALILFKYALIVAAVLYIIKLISNRLRR